MSWRSPAPPSPPSGTCLQTCTALERGSIYVDSGGYGVLKTASGLQPQSDQTLRITCLGKTQPPIHNGLYPSAIVRRNSSLHSNPRILRSSKANRPTPFEDTCTKKTPSKAPFAPADDEDNAVSRAFLMCIKRASTPTSGWRSARWHTRALSPTLEQRFCEFWRGRHRQPTIGKRGLVGQKSWALASGAPIFTSQPSVERLLEGLIARTQRRGEGAHVHERH